MSTYAELPIYISQNSYKYRSRFSVSWSYVSSFITLPDTYHWQMLILLFYTDCGSCKESYAPCTDTWKRSGEGRAQAAPSSAGRYQQAGAQASPTHPLVWPGFPDHPGRPLLQAHVLGVLLGCHGAHHVLHDHDGTGCGVCVLPHHIKGSNLPWLHGKDVWVSAEEADPEAELQPGEVPGAPEALQGSPGEGVRRVQPWHGSSPWAIHPQMTKYSPLLHYFFHSLGAIATSKSNRCFLHLWDRPTSSAWDLFVGLLLCKCVGQYNPFLAMLKHKHLIVERQAHLYDQKLTHYRELHNLQSLLIHCFTVTCF